MSLVLGPVSLKIATRQTSPFFIPGESNRSENMQVIEKHIVIVFILYELVNTLIVVRNVVTRKRLILRLAYVSKRGDIPLKKIYSYL